jgi:hypothetical protein
VANKEKVGILLRGKKLNESKREILLAAKLVDSFRFEVKVFAKKSSWIKAEIKQNGMEFVKLGKLADRHDFNASLKFTQILKKHKVTTILFRDFDSTNLLVTAKYLMKGRLRLVLIQNRHTRELDQDVLRTFRFNQIDAWVTPVSQTANGVRILTNLPSEKIHVLPMPIPRKPFQVDEEEVRLRKNILFGEVPPIVVGWAVPSDRSLFQRTSRLLLKILRANTEVRVCLNLENATIEEFLAEVPELKIFENRMKATSFSHKDADMYVHLDFLLVDIEHEPFAGLFNRALLACVVPVASKSVLTGELSLNGSLGIVYSEVNCNDVIEVVNNEAIRKQYQTRIREHIGKQFTKKRFKNDLETLLDSLPKKAEAS